MKLLRANSVAVIQSLLLLNISGAQMSKQRTNRPEKKEGKDEPMANKNYRLELSLADQVRLGKAIADFGGNPQSVVKSLIRDFFCDMGVKNPARKNRISPSLSHTRRV